MCVHSRSLAPGGRGARATSPTDSLSPHRPSESLTHVLRAFGAHSSRAPPLRLADRSVAVRSNGYYTLIAYPTTIALGRFCDETLGECIYSNLDISVAFVTEYASTGATAGEAVVRTYSPRRSPRARSRTSRSTASGSPARERTRRLPLALASPLRDGYHYHSATTLLRGSYRYSETAETAARASLTRGFWTDRDRTDSSRRRPTATALPFAEDHGTTKS